MYYLQVCLSWFSGEMRKDVAVVVGSRRGQQQTRVGAQTIIHENVPPPATYYRAVLALWRSAATANESAVFPGNPPIPPMQGGVLRSKPERESQKMTSRLQWSREGGKKKKVRARSLSSWNHNQTRHKRRSRLRTVSRLDASCFRGLASLDM